MTRVTVPGIVWITLIVTLATTLGPWLDQYIGKPWGPLCVILLGALVKALQVWLDYIRSDDSQPTRSAAAAPAKRATLPFTRTPWAVVTPKLDGPPGVWVGTVPRQSHLGRPGWRSGAAKLAERISLWPFRPAPWVQTGKHIAQRQSMID